MAFWETVLGKYIMTMAIAAVPVVELRGAIPAGIAAGLDPWLACGAAIFGNLLPVPFITGCGSTPSSLRKLMPWSAGPT